MSDEPCGFCSSKGTPVYHAGICPKVTAIEYFPDGRIKRVTFVDPMTILHPDPREKAAV